MVNEHNILSMDRYMYDDDDDATTICSPISFTFEDLPATPPISPHAHILFPRHKYKTANTIEAQGL
jgi:hypothetical protein